MSEKSKKRFMNWIEDCRARRVVRILKPYIHGTTLDVGCWDGHVTKQLDHDDIIGIDSVAPPKPQIEVRQFNGTQIPFEDKAFDTVVCSTVLHHAEDPKALLEEMKRVGKKIVVLEDAYDTVFDKMSVLLLHALIFRLEKMPYQVSGFRSGKSWKRFFTEHSLKVTLCTRHSSIIPTWLFLRHYLFVLEHEEPARDVDSYDAKTLSN